MSTTDSDSQWQTAAQIREQEFRAGYEIEAGRGELRPTERSDGRSDDIEHNHTEGTASETTLYADISNQKGYDPNEPLPSCEKYATKRAKFSRLWTLNAGRDGHRANGTTYKDKEVHKVSQPARDRARFVHAVANWCGLPKTLSARCRSIAQRTDPRAFNYYGGMDTFILAIVAFVAVAHGSGGGSHGDIKQFHAIREEWDVGIDDLGAAIEKIEEKEGKAETRAD